MTRPLEITRGPDPDLPWTQDAHGNWVLDGNDDVIWLEGRLRGTYCPAPIEWPEDYDSDPLTTVVSFAGTVLFCVTVWAGAALGFVGVIDLVAKAAS